MRQYSMIKDPPGKALLFFAFPVILGNLFQQFYQMTDSVIVGQFLGEGSLAAVGASQALTTVFVMAAIGSGMGACVVIAQYLGAGRMEHLLLAVGTALSGILIFSIVCSLTGFLAGREILYVLHTPGDIFEDALSYLQIYFLGLPFLFLYNMLSSVFHALGDSRTPFYLLLFSSVFNIGADLLLVAGFHTGIEGAAAATVAAQGVSVAAGLFLLKKALQKKCERGIGKWRLQNEHFENERTAAQEQQPPTAKSRLLIWQPWKWISPHMASGMVKVALPSMLQQSVVSIGMLLVQGVVNRFGTAVVAGCTAGSRIESICIVPMIAMGNAMSTFTAQNLGAEMPERVRKGYRAAAGIIVCFGAGIWFLLFLLQRPLLSFFLKEGMEGEAFLTGEAYISFLMFFFVLIGFKAISDGVLRGAGDMTVFTIANLVNLGVRVAFACLMAGVLGIQAAWIAVPAGWAANGLISFLHYRSGKIFQKKILQEP